VTDLPPDLNVAAHSNDAFFKAVFSEPHRAVAFFKSHLPAAIVAQIDWESLEVVPASFVKSSLQQVHSDLLFSVSYKGRRILLYLLFEHQSTPDPAIRLRLLGYILEILQRHHQAHGLPLPPVLPFVFHQGPETWHASTAFEQLFELPEDLAASLLQFVPKFHHALLDLTRFDPVGQETEPELQMVLQLMKLARERQLLRFFEWLAGCVVEQIPDSLLAAHAALRPPCRQRP
jgi:predicted transposase/invertase (TIGR01784 family)